MDKARDPLAHLIDVATIGQHLPVEPHSEAPTVRGEGGGDFLLRLYPNPLAWLEVEARKSVVRLCSAGQVDFRDESQLPHRLGHRSARRHPHEVPERNVARCILIEVWARVPDAEELGAFWQIGVLTPIGGFEIGRAS